MRAYLKKTVHTFMSAKIAVLWRASEASASAASRELHADAASERRPRSTSEWREVNSVLRSSRKESESESVVASAES